LKEAAAMWKSFTAPRHCQKIRKLLAAPRLVE
jgi:hypothetical protein